MQKTRKILSLSLLLAVIGTNVSLYSITQADEYTAQYQQYQSNPSSSYSSKPVYTAQPTYQSTNVLKGQVSTIPANTSVSLTLDQPLSTVVNKAGEIFVAKIDSPIVQNGVEIIPAGSDAIGQITYLKPAGRGGQHAAMDIKFTNIKLPNGQRIPIMGKLETVDKSGILKGGSLKNQIVTEVATGALSTAGGTLAGLGVGSLMGAPGGGAALGVTTGGILGIGYMFTRKGKEVNVPVGSKMVITLQYPVTVGQ